MKIEYFLNQMIEKINEVEERLYFNEEVTNHIDNQKI